MPLKSTENYGDEICLPNTDGAALVVETLTVKVIWHGAADGWALLPAHHWLQFCFLPIRRTGEIESVKTGRALVLVMLAHKDGEGNETSVSR